MAQYRGKFNHRYRRLAEMLIGAVLAGGHVARWSTRFGLQGRLGVTRHEVMLPAGRALARPLRIAFVGLPCRHHKLWPLPGRGQRCAGAQPWGRRQ
jgi:hypothetical protein